jgi:hypothetical protein
MSTKIINCNIDLAPCLTTSITNCKAANTCGKIHKRALFYKMVHGITRKYLQDVLHPNLPPQHSYTLSNDDNFKFILPQVKTTSYMNIFLLSTIRLWNYLPLYFRNIPSLTSLKNALKISTSHNPIMFLILSNTFFTRYCILRYLWSSYWNFL